MGGDVGGGRLSVDPADLRQLRWLSSRQATARVSPARRQRAGAGARQGGGGHDSYSLHNGLNGKHVYLEKSPATNLMNKIWTIFHKNYIIEFDGK
jgi:hypothetical protein